MADNVLKFPNQGKAILLDDQGVYFALNAKNGMVHSIFRLDFEHHWYLHQLQKTNEIDEFGWVLMAEHANDTLQKMSSFEVNHHFSKPEFAEPKGVWQVLRNSAFGFGKFTPQNQQEPIRFALMAFKNNVMSMPIMVIKADEATLKRAETALNEHLEFA
jgi:hypothetical protein